MLGHAGANANGSGRCTLRLHTLVALDPHVVVCGT